MVLNGELSHLTFNFPWFKEPVHTLIRRRALLWVYTDCQYPKCPSPSFTDNPLTTALWRHSDKNRAAIFNRYLDFVLRAVWWVNDNHVDNYLKETLALVYYGSMVKKNLHKKGTLGKKKYLNCE